MFPSLSFFHPLIRQWFSEKIGMPTDVQDKAWPAIAEGRHVLVTAPTGCGKTLAAFLWGLNQLITGAWPAGKVRVLYISPLKALNNDVQRNLLKPLRELREYFSHAETPFPDIHVLTRSGDTPGEERRKMIRKPPEILITTPESLNLLLTSRSGRSMLEGIATVILDEIHAVGGTKRGTHLITAVDRLVPLAGEFQRIALSATVNPPERVAEFVGGFQRTGRGMDSRYEKRRVTIIRSDQAKTYEIKVSFPVDAREKMVDGSWWPALIDAFRENISRHRSTLLFANSRRTTEKVTRLINEASAPPQPNTTPLTPAQYRNSPHPYPSPLEGEGKRERGLYHGGATSGSLSPGGRGPGRGGLPGKEIDVHQILDNLSPVPPSQTPEWKRATDFIEHEREAEIELLSLQTRGGAVSPLTRGSVLHRCLEEYAKQGAWDLGMVIAEYPEIRALEQDAVRAFRDDAEAVLKAVITDKELSWIFERKADARAELPFLYKRGNSFVSGIIDRVVVRDNKGFVIDYKAILIESDEALGAWKAHYRPQLQVYCEAVKDIFGLKAVEGSLLFLDSRRLETVVSL